MGAAARSWDHPRWSYDETRSAAARRSAARAAERALAPTARPGPRVVRQEARVRVGPQAHAKTHAEMYARPVARAHPSVRPALRVVPRPRARFGPIVVLVTVLGLALLAPVGLNLAVVRSQTQVAQLQQHVDDLVAERSALMAEQAGLSSTQRVKETADRLGMVTPPEVGFVDLGGRVAGEPAADPAAAVAGVDGGGDPEVVALASEEAGSAR